MESTILEKAMHHKEQVRKTVAIKEENTVFFDTVKDEKILKHCTIKTKMELCSLECIYFQVLITLNIIPHLQYT